MSVWMWLGVALVGGAGALARALVELWVSHHERGPFPTGVLVVNVTGAVALGLVTGLGLHGDALVLAGAATLGAYTTFSTWMLDSERLALQGRHRLATLNVAVGLGLGLAAVTLGRLIG